MKWLLLLAGFALVCSGQERSTDNSPPVLHVEGTRLVTGQGHEVRLQGLNLPSLEWSATGEHLLQSLPVAVTEWRANVIRLPLAQDRWFGKTRSQEDGGKAYRELVDQLVDYCSSHGAYIVVDLHWSDAGVWGRNIQQKKMPDTNSLAFWQDAAKRYANRSAVLFDLYNEPHDVSWQVWRDGGMVTETNRRGETLVYQSPGMQSLLDTVRQTGAKNVVVAGGLDWAYDLTGLLNGFALEEKGGRGIIYAAHIYPSKRDWNGKVGRAAEKYPVFVGEVGCQVDTRHESPYTWAPDALGYIQRLHLSWAAWCFHPSASPRIIEDWTYAPTPYWGAFVHSALAGKVFPAGQTR
jgi:hypothetical protein